MIIKSFEFPLFFTFKLTGHIYENGLNLKCSEELMEFFALECDKDLTNLKDGEEFNLSATEETGRVADLWRYYTINGYNVIGRAIDTSLTNENTKKCW